MAELYITEEQREKCRKVADAFSELYETADVMVADAGLGTINSVGLTAFYMKQNDDGKTVAAVDCLVPGIGEIIGGSQREDDYDKLYTRMKELGLGEEDYGFYMDLRKYGSTRHSGFGLGFERCIMYLTGMSNIRDVVPFPRTVNNCD